MKNPTTQILLLEDHKELGSSLVEKLRDSDFKCQWFKSVQDAKNHSHLQSMKLFILDVGLPDGNGFEFAQWLREQKLKAPLIFLTAMGHAENRLKGYQLGAEEFIPKPFLFKELELRIHHVLDNHAASWEYQYKDLTINFDALTLKWKDGSIVFPQAKDLQILKLLIQKSPQIVTRDEILNGIWEHNQFPSERTVDNSIVRIRQALKHYQKFLKSARGLGYHWIPKEML